MRDKLPRVLLVDDEPSLLLSLKLHLRRKFQVFTATSGAEGLAILQREGPFAVVVSDMRMPGMDGAAFLAQARRNHPDTIRMLLTGYADLSSAMSAVNEGYIFRFLTKPCEPDAMLRLLEAGVEQHRLLTADRQLLEQRLGQLSSQLLHAERLATLGTLAGGVGHELNNVAVVFVSALAELDRCANEDRPPDEDALHELRWVGEHLKLHATNLLDLGRPGDNQKKTLDLRPIVEETLQTLRAVGRTKRAVVEIDLPSVPVWIHGNRTQLEQVLMNLVGNASDALVEYNDAHEGHQPKLWVSVGFAGESATLKVSDNGGGIPEDKLATIFEPYFTTKPVGKGTGLGLVVVRRVVEEHQGTVTVDSRVGAGATFTITLPLKSA